MLAGHPALTVRSREAITLPAEPELRVPAERPAALPDGDVRLDASFSVRDPSAPAATLSELREGARITVAAPPLVLRDHAAAPPPLVLPVPEALRGQQALLTVVARPLPPSPLVRVETEEVDVAPGTPTRSARSIANAPAPSRR